jgi:DNA adenine methylase
MGDPILARQPAGAIGEYRELMLGGGSIASQVARAVPAPVWVNDADNYLIDCYLGIRDRCPEIMHKAKQLMPYAPGQDLCACRNRFIANTFHRFVRDPNVDPALRYYLCNRVGWNGRVNFNLPRRMHCTCPEYWNITAIDRLKSMSATMRHWEITAHDYSMLLDEPGRNVWCVIDPPYWRDTCLTRSAKLYRLNFTVEDHQQLAARVAACRHNVLLTYDDCPEIRELYPKSAGFRHHVELVQYVGTSRRRWTTELIITNYLPLTHEEE